NAGYVIDLTAERQGDGGNLAELAAQVGRLLQAVRAGLAQTFLPHLGEVHVRGEGDERLVRADVRRRFAAADVLLARGEGQHVGAFAVDVDRLADQPSRHMAFERIADDHEADVRTAVLWRNTPGLSFAAGDVEAVRARRGVDTEGRGL